MTVIAVVLLGFAVRLIGLTGLGDLEFDEIVSVRYANLPAGELLPRLAGALFEHPPAFYLALGGWRALAGNGDAAARLFSVFPGTITVALAYAVGRRLDSHRTGTLAALLVAVAPLSIFYSREARMYALVTCLALASFWLFVRALARPRQAAFWVLFATIGVLTSYVHYLGAMMLAAQLAAALALGRHARHVIRPLALTAAAVVLLAVPWLLVAGGSWASLPALSFAHLTAAPAAIGWAWIALVAGPGRADGFTDPAGNGLVLGVAAAALLALAAVGLGRLRGARLVVASSLLAGLAGALFVVALGKPAQARYILPAAPLVYVCAAAGLATRSGSRCGGTGGRRQGGVTGIVGAAALLAGFVPFWWSYYGGYARADYSAVTRHIAAQERPGDGVLLTGPWQAWYFDYYYAGNIVHDVLPDNAPPALDPAAARPELEQLAATHRRLWLVQAGLAQADPTNFVERWLQHRAWPAWRQALQNAVVSLFALDPPRRTRPLSPAVFDGRIRLTAGTVDAEEVPAGDVVRLTLEMELLQAASADYKASLRLVGSDGQQVATDFVLLDRSGEAEAPTTSWTPGRPVAIRRGMWIPPSLGPQPYELRLVVYDPATLAPLPPGAGARALAAGGAAAVGSVYVTQSLARATTGELPRPSPGDGAGRAEQVFGGGDDFDSIEFVELRWHQPDASAGPLAFDLVWRLVGRSGTEHRSLLRVLDSRGRTWHEELRPLFGGAFAMRDWREGEALTERRSLDLSTLPQGRYRVIVGLDDARGHTLPVAGAPGALEVATFDVPYQRPWGDRLTGLASRLGGALSRVARR
jgi:4-amino-4-deoxy-L-arabinose transferase-like glycosyltransferase